MPTIVIVGIFVFINREIFMLSEKSAFEHAQKVQIQIILRMHKESWHLLNINTFVSIQWIC